MAPISLRPRYADRPHRTILALLCAALLAPGEGALLAQEAAKPATTTAPAGGAEPAPVKLSPDQLDSLVAPIALYPDDLLAQTLAASTYPLEIVQLQQWLAKNPKLKDKALADAVAKQPWDPAIQSMAAVPEVVKRLADDIQWTTQLGDAFLDQQSDVMEACQRMRKKAEEKGALKSNEQQTVETKVVENKTVIVVQPTNPEVIYVPTYSPTVVYPPPVYPYPPIYYPPYYAGAAFVTFTAGVMIGAAVWGGACCHCGWGGNNVNINVNNNFNRNTNINSGNVNRGQGGNNWQHNAQHRGGAPYSNKATANKYGGSARGDAAGSRGQGAGGAGNRGASAGSMDRGAGGAGNRGASAGSMDRGAGGAGNRGASAGSMDRGGGGDRVGNQSIPSGGGSKSAFSGGSGGYSGSSAKASSSRGSSSMSSRGGGGGSRGGGGGRGGRR
jgi:hypothetical protein